jgi:hypothetical protein
MAIASNPHEPWFANEEKSLYWLPIKKFDYADDISGHEYIQLQTEIREFAANIRAQLVEHDIAVANVATQQHLDHRALGSRVAMAIGFKTKEELVLAKLILNRCDELD